MPSSTLPIPAAAAAVAATRLREEEVDKYYSQSPTSRRTARRRKSLFVFALFALLLVFLAGPFDILANPFASVATTIRSWFPFCHSDKATNDMSSSTTTTHPHVAGKAWHARALEHAQTTRTEFEIKKEDLVLTVLLNSQVEPEGFTMALFKPLHAVDASGRRLTLSKADFDAFTSDIEAVKELPSTGEFGGQWRVKHERTGYPIDRVLIPGQDEVSVYGWSKDVDTLESETQGLDRLPASLQQLIGLAKEARDGYRRGHRDETVVEQVLALTNA
ncbi:hypothetical protein FS842_009363 [Serendipita sp. 407]|nr:hypothetical protein FS842_009363 [Serendipita sp. 407]